MYYNIFFLFVLDMESTLLILENMRETETIQFDMEIVKVAVISGPQPINEQTEEDVESISNEAGSSRKKKEK